LLLSILAMVAAAFLPLAATSQIFHRHTATAADKGEASNKYEIFAGYGYTSLNQVNQSRNGLQGVSLSVTRDWGRFFGLTADGGFYKYPYDAVNPGDPSVNMLLFGPVLHAHIAGHVDGFVHVLLGGEHTGGENATPTISFAGGVGGGLDYKLSPHLALRASGDNIASSFVAETPAPPPGTSPHEHRNARASFGVVLKF
jgi:hypothetical protein